MPIHDYFIDNGTGANVRADINAALSAIVSLNSNPTEPGTMYAYQLWADTTSNLLKIRNSGNSAWITLRQLDGDFSIVAVEDGLQATPSLTFTNDLNTGVFRSGTDALAIVTGGQYAIACTSTQAVGIKTANPSTALHVAGNARVGADDVTDAHLQIGKGATGNRNSYIDIVADTTYTDYGLRVIRNNTGANATSELKHRGTGALNFTTEEAAPIVFNTTNSPALTILAGGNVGIGTSGPSNKLTIYDAAANPLRLIQDHGTSSAYGLEFYSAASTPYIVSSLTASHGAAYVNPYLDINVSDTSRVLQPRVRIDASGNVGIGTTGPEANANLTVYGAGIAISKTSDTVTPSTFDLKIRSADPKIGVHVTNTAQTATLEFGTAGDNANGAFINVAGADPLRFGTNNTEKARIDSSGRLLVGTDTSPSVGIPASALFVVQGYTGVPTGDSLISLQRGQAPASITSGAQLGAISFGANDGSPYAQIHAATDGAGAANDYPGRLVFSTTADEASSPTPRMTIKNDGDVLIGTTSPQVNERLRVVRDSITSNAATVDIYNSAAISTTKLASSILRISSQGAGADASIVMTDNDSYNYFFGGNNGGAYVTAMTNGVRLSNGGTSWASDSDERVKDIIEPIQDGLDKVGSLRAVIGKYKTDDEDKRRSFLIAQDVQAVLPEAVFDEQGTLMLAYTDTIPLLVAALKESKERIEQLETSNTDLLARVIALEAN
jgi:hypothetical protein